ncbi:MAG: hypothetical protein Q4B75_10330 [Eubacteriales bacterium]|nr:hypothetical protein [Eubacteriales bacterium]
MIFGRNVDMVEDTRGRKLLYMRDENTYYLLEDKLQKYVLFLKNNIINAISGGAMLGYFIRLPYWMWAVIAIAWYVAYIVFFNVKIFPRFEKLKEKKIKVAPPSETKGRMLIFALGFLAVGIGLFLCIPLGQVNGNIDGSVVVACGIFSFIMGVNYLNQYRKA